MPDFYKLSGKVSPAFFLYLLVSLIFIIPIFSFLQAVVFWYSPVIIIALAGTAICLLSVALLCGNLCITKGKVRNKKIAAVAALLTGLTFTFLSLVFYCAFYENRFYPMEITAFFTKLTYLPDSIGGVLEQGISLSRKSSVRIQGGLLVALWVVGFLLAQIVILVNYVLETAKPFIEKRKQWAQEITLEFDYIEDQADFTDKIIAGDPNYIAGLSILRDANVSHSTFELYPMEDSYYLSVDNKKANAADKNGRVKFEEDTIFEYLSVSKQAGDMLMAKQIHQAREQVEAKIVSKHTKRREIISLLKNALVAAFFFFCVIQAFRHGQIKRTDFTASAILFCSVACVIYYILCAIGSFAKEDVIVLEDTMFDEDWLPHDATTNVYHIEQKDSGPLYKAFYLLMSVASIGFLSFMIYFNSR